MSHCGLLLVFVLSLCCGSLGYFPEKTKTLYIGGIFPMEGGWAGGLGCRPAVDMALEDINSRLDIIPGYHLEMVSNDSQCEPGLGMNVMYELLYKKPTKLMLLGPGCSAVSTFVGQAARMWNLVVLSYGSSSPALSNRKRFPTFFRTHPSGTLHNPVRVKMFKKFGWTHIATIKETKEVFTSTVEDLEERVKDAGIEITVRTSFLTDPANAVKNLKRQDARIIVGVFYEDMARRVFCEVYKQKMYGPKRLWFIIGWYPDNWYAVNDPSINCTAEQMKEALEGHITTEGLMLYNGRDRTLSNMTASEFMDKVQQRIKDSHPLSVTGYVEAPLAYDAVWALALALNNTQRKLAKEGRVLEEFDYSRTDIMREIYSAMNSTNFLGVSGRVAFSSDGDRITLSQIEQMWNGTYTMLGYYDMTTDNFTEWYNTEKWLGGKKPSDRTIVQFELRVVSLGLFVAMTFLSLIGIIIASWLLMFNCYNRKRRFLASSQPHVNSLMLVGCMICLGCVILQGLDGQFLNEKAFTALCQIRTIVLTLGFTLAYGPMFAKVWTIYRLTTRRKKEIKPFREFELYMVVGLFLALDVVVLTCLQVLDPLYRKLEYFDPELPTDTEEDIKIKPELEHCVANHINIWRGVMFGYKGVLLLFGLLLAYETRNVKIKQINDSRFVGMSIYNVVVLCLITAPVSLIISSHQDASFAFVAVAVLLSCFLAMGLVFMPKVLELNRHPGEGLDMSGVTDHLHSHEEEVRHQRLLQENEHIKRQIAEKEEKILELKRKLDTRAVHTHVTFHSNQSGAKSVPTEVTVASHPLHQNYNNKPSGGGILKSSSPRLQPSKQHNMCSSKKAALVHSSHRDPGGNNISSSSGLVMAGERPNNVSQEHGIQLTVINSNYRPRGQSPPTHSQHRARRTHLIEPSVDSGLASSVFSSSMGTTPRSSRLPDDRYSEEYC